MTTARRAWTQTEEDYMKENYATSKYFELTFHLGRSEKVICKKAQTMGLKKEQGKSVGAVYLRKKKAVDGEVKSTGMMIQDFALGNNFSLAHMPKSGRKYCGDMNI